ncbi:LysR family transcriptional regulator [Shewanella avicenniae]|uniref:LysR family transcriptional regulator n=1 Tax=Shewanella avicenniae TaxID=2814294 RepID=A0ABX7QT61_9GAMM|nr:LysR family transcriptional regulator [Shewanella avicenniae]QSX34653.1 LysR family transcriptional regulator [Shewanella avicenniae]
MMDLNQLKIFAKVVEKSSFTGAAKALGLTKTTVSRKINELETRVGVQLLTRTTRSVRPTTQGIAFYHNIADAFNAMMAAEQQLMSLQHDTAGKISIVIPHELETVFSSEIFSSFIAAHPEIELDIALSSRYPAQALDDNVDVIFHFTPLTDSQLETLKLLNFDRLITASPSYLRQHGIPFSPADLELHSYIDCTAAESGANEQRRIQIFDGETWTTVNTKVTLSMDSTALAKELAIAGVGIAALPQSLAAEEIAKGTLVEVLHDFPIRSNILYMSYTKQLSMPTRTLRFIEHLYSQLSALFVDELLESPEFLLEQAQSYVLDEDEEEMPLYGSAANS